jgi:hypothetical protein
VQLSNIKVVIVETVQITEHKLRRKGLATSISLPCKACGFNKSSVTSKSAKKYYEDCTCSKGRKLAGICAVMNL